MMRKFDNIRRIIFLAVLCIMVLIPTSMGGGVNGNLYLIAIDGTYYTDSDSWYEETSVTDFGDFDLKVSNHAPQEEKIVYFLYILTAVNMNPSSVEVKINSIPIPITGWIEADGINKPTFPTTDNYQYPMTIYKPGTWYNITKINLSDTPLYPRENMTIQIYAAGPDDALIHFDGAGADVNNKAILTVPSSHDAMSHVPEFSTIALPIAAILGIMFILQSRRRKED